MKLLMYGVNKETVMKEDTIKYFLDEQKKRTQMINISNFAGVEELAVLTTNFRNEYYLYVDEDIFSHGEFLRYLAEETDKTLQEIILETYSKFNEDVLRHIFEVASGYLTNPKGSFNVLESVEDALTFANKLDTSGEVLYKMFKTATYLAYDLKLEDVAKPLNQTQISKYIYLLKDYMGELEKKNYLISGNDIEVYYLTKLLLFAGARSISIIQKDETEAQRQYNNLVSALNELEINKIYPITEKSLYYRLSKVDAAIIDTDQVELLKDEIFEEVSIIRQTRKLQYLIDTAKEPTIDIDFSNLDIRYINGLVDFTYNDEEQADAMVIFEDKLSTQINEFMNYLENIQINKVKEQLFK